MLIPPLLLASLPTSLSEILLLVLISFVGGIGITAIGPGGVLVTIALFAFTDLSPSEVAGTAIVTHVGTGIVGSLAYLRSGQLRHPLTQRLAVVLSAAALIGTPIGVLINRQVSSHQFGILLAILVAFVGLTIILRERRSPPAMPHPAAVASHLPFQAALGGGVAIVSGLFGVGGPLIAVPLMVVSGLPLLSALAAAQVQSIIVAGTGTLTYLVHDAVSWPLVVMTGVPEMIGVWLGWHVARAFPARPLKYLLAATLIVLAPILVLYG